MIEFITKIRPFFDYLFLAFGVVIFFTYFVLALFSAIELRFYLRKNKYVSYYTLLGSHKAPSVSIIAPAFNEEKNIVENVRSLITLYYPDLEVIIVNDGSTDSTLQKLINSYQLQKVEVEYEQKILTKKVLAIYKSKNKALHNLVVIDKENGGKGDALNAGINYSSKSLFMSIDVDCILEQDAVLKMVKPFMEEAGGKKVIASGGVVRIANSCIIDNGRIEKVIFPKNFWAKFQVLEYVRAFILGRMAWGKLNGLLIISGAFGMFDKKITKSVGGYNTKTVGEDLELVVRMRRYMNEIAKTDYRVTFIPDPLCWTEVPSSLKVLSKQRNRWTRGSVDTLIKHKKLFFNPKYGKLGLLSYPYWFFFEWLAPFVEVAGYIYFIILAVLGLINFSFFILLVLFVIGFSLMFSSWAIFFDAYTYNKYTENRYFFQIVFFAFLEIFIYHPIMLFFSLKGNFDYFFRRKRTAWGTMTRTAFDSEG